MSTVDSTPTVASRRKGVRNRLILLVAVVMALCFVTLGVAVSGLLSAKAQNDALGAQYTEYSLASAAQNAWTNVDDLLATAPTLVTALAHARGVPVLIDGAQSTPHLPVNVTALLKNGAAAYFGAAG